MPAYAGAAIALVTPGTTSNGTPAARRASASSPPRPKTNGSPPFNRITVAPVCPRSTRRRSMSAWVIATRPGALPTSMRSAEIGASSSSRGDAKRAPTRVGVVDRAEDRESLGIIVAALDRERALCDLRQHDARFEHLGCLRAPAEPFERRGRNHDGVDFARAGYARLDIAAQAR